MSFNRKSWVTLAVLGVVALLGAAWALWFEDFDFYRPPVSLQCSAPPVNSHPVRFIAFGDYGEGTPFQMGLANQMEHTYRQTPFQYALLLGDNIYPNGDIQRLGKAYFSEPYAPLLRNNVQFIATLGDHDDHKGHREDEMAFFKMPNEFYQVSEGMVDFFVLNTTKFVRNPAQRAWIEQALAKSKAPWKVVIGHHPLYSSGRNGNTKGLKAILEPMMMKYHADLYLAGHDHDYERFHPVGGVHYVVSGGGGAFLYDFRRIIPESLVHIRTHHFLLVELLPDHLWLKAINRQGEVIDCADWAKPQADEPTAR